MFYFNKFIPHFCFKISKLQKIHQRISLKEKIKFQMVFLIAPLLLRIVPSLFVCLCIGNFHRWTWVDEIRTKNGGAHV